MSKDVVLSFQKSSTVFINYLGVSSCHFLRCVSDYVAYTAKLLPPMRSQPRNNTKAYQRPTFSKRWSW